MALNVGANILAHPSIIAPNKNYLFMVSHMRAFSTLISHILGSHPDISGHIENHIEYKNTFDLLKLRHRVASVSGCGLEGSYVLEKIVHNYEISDSIINRSDTKFCLTIREPLPTLKSIISMKMRFDGKDEKQLYKPTLKYYIDRLDGIQALAMRLEGRFLFFKGEVLVTDADVVLHDLTEWLGLSSPLKKDYEVREDTGVAGRGDFSDDIRGGRIVGIRDKYKSINIPEAMEVEAVAKYIQTVSLLEAM